MEEMIIRLDDAVATMDVLGDKFKRLKTSLSWFKEDNFEFPHLRSEEERMEHSIKYHEQFIFIEQHVDLFDLYIKHFDEINEEFMELFTELRKSVITKKAGITQADQSEVIPTNKDI